ncbi:SH3 domain-containing protein [Xylariomycetidae sp. FL0641]|nr:SH3 domain-containing protein [Xylariomycetidae sp. FL0641]
MVTVDRQEIIATNKSLRLIKNELEGLLEKGAITDDAFDTIHRLLPTEAPLGPAAPSPAAAAAASPSPVSSAPSPPVHAMANLAMHAHATPSPAPPAYAAAGPPALPTRNNPPPPPPGKPVIAHARALYRYQAADDRDLSFERDDRIAVYEYMNADWWMGRNERSGAEGIFPKNYVQPAEGAEKGYQPQQSVYTPPPQAQNPYNAHAPPMAVANEGGGGATTPGGSKVNENGKKFGKKLGNAAIFGAGATIGSNLVNSIF